MSLSPTALSPQRPRIGSPRDAGDRASAWLVCCSCRRSLTRIREPLCGRCGAPTAWPVARCAECSGRRLAFASARAAVVYGGPARELVRAWKERGLRPLAGFAADVVAEVIPRPAADVITYIPPDGDRSLRRGHQPAAELARELGVRWSIESQPLLGRTRPVDRQAGLTIVERRRNVRDAFAGMAEPSSRHSGSARRAAPEALTRQVYPRVAVLVDDVYTTGATVGAAASALRTAGVRTVHVVTFARAIR
jgi:predicted amidophosphoribosyltransferase